MPNRRLQAYRRRLGIRQLPQIGTGLIIGFGAVAGNLRPRREGNHIFQVDTVFRHGRAQTKVLNAVGIEIIIDIIRRSKQAVMGLMDDMVDGTAVGAVIGNGLHGPKTFTVIITIIHDGIIALLELIGIGLQALLPFCRSRHFQNILRFTAIVMNDGLRPKS